MQTITALASGYRLYPDVGAPTERHQPGSKQGRTGNQKNTKSTNDFLTTVFKPVHISEMNPLYSENNYMYLYDSARNYADLLGVNFPLLPESRSFEVLYETLRKLLPGNEELTIRINRNRLQFIVTENFDEHTLYYIPCCIIDRTKDKVLKDIYTSFFSILQSSQKLTTLKEDMAWDIFQEELDKDNIDEEDRWVLLLADYSTGHIANVLDAISKKSKYDIHELARIINRYKPKTKKESVMLDLMQEGLKLFKKDSIMRYSRPPVEEDKENYPVHFYRMMHIVYDPDDLVFENLFEWVCNEAQDQGYEILSSGEIRISPKTKRTLKHNGYISQYLNWLNRFCYELHNL